MTWMRELIGTGLLLTGSAAFVVVVEQSTRRSPARRLSGLERSSTWVV